MRVALVQNALGEEEILEVLQRSLGDAGIPAVLVSPTSDEVSNATVLITGLHTRAQLQMARRARSRGARVIGLIEHYLETTTHLLDRTRSAVMSTLAECDAVLVPGPLRADAPTSTHALAMLASRLLGRARDRRQRGSLRAAGRDAKTSKALKKQLDQLAALQTRLRECEGRTIRALGYTFEPRSAFGGSVPGSMSVADHVAYVGQSSLGTAAEPTMKTISIAHRAKYIARRERPADEEQEMARRLQIDIVPHDSRSEAFWSARVVVTEYSNAAYIAALHGKQVVIAAFDEDAPELLVTKMGWPNVRVARTEAEVEHAVTEAWCRGDVGKHRVGTNFDELVAYLGEPI